jgi:signal transduction histidine kinase
MAERDRAEVLRAEVAREAHGRLAAQSAALAEADRRKDEFLAMLGHELRNPLAPIRNALYVMRARETAVPGAAVPEADRLLGILERQVAHLARLVDDLLDLSRITRGEFALRREPADLRTVVAASVESARPLFEGLGHSLRVDQPDGELPVEADAVRLEQVVTNLLNNAAKYTEPGGHVRVRLARDGDAAELTVTDDGVGITAEFLPRVFDLFSQSERSLDRKQGGLGIGHPLVHRPARHHEGTVEVRRAGPARGTEVRDRLPVAPSARAAAAPAPAAAQAGAPRRAGAPAP